MTEKEFQELNARLGGTVTGNMVTGNIEVRPPRRFVAPSPIMLEGPVNLVLTLHGHCPSKKNLWRRGSAGKMFLDTEVKAKIETLTMQALFQWGLRGPVKHPELTIRFFVAAPQTRKGTRTMGAHTSEPGKVIEAFLVADNRDQDGMYTTVLDCLQSAGVILNDNIRWNNGRKVLEPVQFVPEADERVEVLVEKK